VLSNLLGKRAANQPNNYEWPAAACIGLSLSLSLILSLSLSRLIYLVIKAGMRIAFALWPPVPPFDATNWNKLPKAHIEFHMQLR